jgi:hypothetical protein
MEAFGVLSDDSRFKSLVFLLNEAPPRPFGRPTRLASTSTANFPQIRVFLKNSHTCSLRSSPTLARCIDRASAPVIRVTCKCKANLRMSPVWFPINCSGTVIPGLLAWLRPCVQYHSPAWIALKFSHWVYRVRIELV